MKLSKFKHFCFSIDKRRIFLKRNAIKKFFISLLTVILTLQLALALPLVFAGKLSTSALGATDADTGGMQYANWYFNQSNLKEVNVVININNDPLTNDGIYFQAYDGYINGQMFYFGLQTRTGKPGIGLTGKGLIFSEFGTTDSSSIRVAPSSWYEVGTYEGPFISTRSAYDWTNHKYALTIKYKESDTIGDWYEFWIEDLSSSSNTYAGALRFPFSQDPSKKGITDGGGTWTELYYREVLGSPLPEWSISILEVSAISKDGAILFPKTAHLKNADNFYHIDQAFHTENNCLDFVIGGNATKSFNEKNITLSSGTIKVNAMLNGSPWNGTLNFTLKREKLYEYTAVPLNLSGYPIGTYVIQYDSSGPTDATISSITPSSTQILTLGSTITFTMNFVTLPLDTTPPEITILTPQENSFTNQTKILIKGLIQDKESGVKNLIINGELIEVFNEGKFEKEMLLTEGENQVKIVAKDNVGNQTEKVVKIILDTVAPQIICSLPSEVYNNQLEISGSVKDEGISGIKDFSILINGKKVGLSKSLTFIDTTNLVEGDNIITLEVEDNAGNKTKRLIVVKFIERIILKLQIGKQTMYVNDKPILLDIVPVIIENRTLLPIRWIAEPLGAKVDWDATERKVTVSLSSTTIELWIGKSTAKVNGIDTPIDSTNPKVVPEIINSRTMLPLRFVTENLGCDVQWDGTTKTITITYPKS